MRGARASAAGVRQGGVAGEAGATLGMALQAAKSARVLALVRGAACASAAPSTRPCGSGNWAATSSGKPVPSHRTEGAAPCGADSFRASRHSTLAATVAAAGVHEETQPTGWDGSQVSCTVTDRLHSFPNAQPCSSCILGGFFAGVRGSDGRGKQSQVDRGGAAGEEVSSRHGLDGAQNCCHARDILFSLDHMRKAVHLSVRKPMHGIMCLVGADWQGIQDVHPLKGHPKLHAMENHAYICAQAQTIGRCA